MNRSLRLAECSHPISRVDVECFAECSPRYRRPSAAVGADLSCPRIRKYTRNGGRICLFGNANMCNW